MTMTTTTPESSIISRLLQPDNLSPEAARGILAMDFTDEDRERMHELAKKASEGKLTEGEQADANAYEFIGSILGIMQSKARQSLKASE